MDSGSRLQNTEAEDLPRWRALIGGETEIYRNVNRVAAAANWTA
jgi:hypothetical protein